MKTEAEKSALFELEKAITGAQKFDEYQKEIIDSSMVIFQALHLEINAAEVNKIAVLIGDVLDKHRTKLGTVMVALAEVVTHGLVHGLPAKKERKEFAAALFLLISASLEDE